MTSFRARRAAERARERVDAAPVRVRSCRDLCDWNRTPVDRRGEPLFACRGCGSQWVPSERWTAVNNDGTVPPEILAIRRAEG